MKNTRYRNNELQLLEKIKDLQKRLARLESNPRLSQASIDTGLLLVPDTGEISVIDNNGNKAIQVKYFTSLNTAVIRLTPHSDTNGDEVVVQASDILFDGINQTFYSFYLRNNTSGNTFGGNYTSGQTFSSMRRLDSNPNQNAAITIREFSIFGVPANLYMEGRWLNEVQMSSTDALYTGSRSIGTGFSSTTITYPITFASTVAPVVGLLNATALDWSLTAQSASSFTVAWATGTAAKTFNMWNIRL